MTLCHKCIKDGYAPLIPRYLDPDGDGTHYQHNSPKEHDLDPREVENRFRTAFSQGTEALCLFVQSNSVGVDHLFSPPGPGWQGTKKSALGIAAEKGDKEMTKTLLGLGADCNLSFGDNTPLIIALQYGNEGVALMLLGAGADPNVGVPTKPTNDPDPITLLGLAWETTKSACLIRALLQHGADPNATVQSPEFPDDTVGPKDFPADLKQLVADIKGPAASAFALQNQKIPSVLIELIHKYNWQ